MHSSALLSFLLAAGASAESIVLLNPWAPAASNVTIRGSNPTATTYENNCPSSSSGGISTTVSKAPSASSAASADSSAAQSSRSAGGTLNLTPITGTPTILPAPTGAKFRARQNNLSNDECEPFTVIQGPSTWEYHISASDLGRIDANCKLGSGGITSGSMTCSASASGPIASIASTSLSLSVVDATVWSELEAYNTANVVTATGSSGSPSTASATATASGKTAATGSAAGSATASQHTGLAPPLPLPTGAMAFVGGAAGIFAAAIAL